MEITAMKVVLIALAFIVGRTDGLQSGLEYHYRYHAQVTAGVKDLRQQAAMTAMQADLVVQAQAPGKAVFQLQNVEVGNYHGKPHCGDGLELPVEYAPPSPHFPGVALGRHAFALSDSEGDVSFVSHEEDEPWLTNIYKSIAGAFRITPIHYTFFVRDAHKPEYLHLDSPAPFRLVRSTILGKCLTINTLNKLSGLELLNHQKFVEDDMLADIQITSGHTSSSYTQERPSRKGARKGSRHSGPQRYTAEGPEITNEMWKLVSSINLDDCNETVEHQFTMKGMHCDASHSQCHNLLSRSSRGEYILRGDEEHGFRLERALVEGALSVSPFGVNHHYVHTLSNQTFTLVSVSPIEEPVNIRTPVSHEAGMYQMTIPYSEGAHSNLEWVRFGDMIEAMHQITSIKITPENNEMIKRKVIELIQLSVNLLFTRGETETPKTSMYLNYAAKLMYQMTVEDLEGMLETCKAKPQHKRVEMIKLFMDLVADVGTIPAIKFILQEKQKGTVSELWMSFVFTTFTNNLKFAESLKDLLTFVGELDIDAFPFLTSQAYVNFASMVNRFCVHVPTKPSDFLSTFSEEKCEELHIFEDFLSLVTEKLEAADKTWHQLIYVESLVNLGDLRAMDKVKQFVRRTDKMHTIVGQLGIGGLAKWKLRSDYYKPLVTDILLEVIENTGEPTPLRTKALSVLLSWDIDASTWQRIALGTWHEHDTNFAAFVYGVLESYSKFEHPRLLKQKQYASHALALARPVAAGKKYSSYNSLIKYFFDGEYGFVEHERVHNDPLSAMAREIVAYYNEQFGGFYSMGKVQLLFEGYSNFFDVMQKVTRGMEPRDPFEGVYGDYATAAHSIYHTIQSALSPDTIERPEFNGVVNIRIFQNMQIFVPLTHEVVQNLGQIMSRERHTLVDYINPVDTALVLPNDVGLAVVISAANPHVMSHNIERNRNEANVDVQVWEAVHTRVEVSVPWSTKIVASGVVKSVLMDFPVHHRFQEHYSPVGGESLRYTVSSSSQQEFSPLSLSTMPYTLLTDIKFLELEDFRPVVPPHTPTEVINFPTQLTGIAGRVEVEGENILSQLLRIENFKHFGHKMKEIMLSLNYQKFKIVFDPAHSATKKATLTFKIAEAGSYHTPTVPDHPINSLGVMGSLFIEGDQRYVYRDVPEVGDHDDLLLQQSQSAQQAQDYMYDEFSEVSQMLGQQAEDEPHGNIFPNGDEPAGHNLQKLQENQNQNGDSGKIFGLSIGLELEGTETRSYETVLSWTKSFREGPHRKSYKIAFMFTRSPLPGHPEPIMKCIDFQVSAPELPHLRSVEEIVDYDVSRSIKAHVYYGTSCNGSPAFTIKGSMDLTDEGKNHLLSELDTSHSCSEEEGDPKKLLMETAMHDELKLLASLQPDCRGWWFDPLELFNVFGFGFKEHHSFMNDENNYCGVSNAEDKLSFVANRNLTTNTWTTVTHLPYKTSVADHVVMNKKLDKFMHLFPGFAESQEESCFVTSDKIHTFDGLDFDAYTGDCWSVLAKDCSPKSRFLVMGRKNPTNPDDIEVRAVMPEYPFIIHWRNDDYQRLSINHREANPSPSVEKVTSEHGNGVAVVITQRNYTTLSIPKMLSLTKTEGKLRIQVNQQFTGVTCGLCGNHDLEAANDVTGPKRCLYKDMDLFRSSWKVRYDPCDAVESEFRRVREFQETCTKITPIPTDYYT